MNMERRSSSTKHRGLKLFALLLAVLLEFYFYSPDNSITSKVEATVEVRDLPHDTVIVEPAGAGEKGIPVQVELRGPESLVKRMRSTFHRFTVLAPQERNVSFSAVVDPQQLQLPSGVEVVSVYPVTVPIRIEEVAKKELEIKLTTEGEAEEDYAIEGYDLSPATVIVRGPKSKVVGLKEIQTEPLFLSTVKNSGPFELRLVSPEGSLITLGVTVVSVSVKVKVVKIEKTFADINVTVLAPTGYAATVEPSKAKATVRGPSSAIRALENRNLSLIADARSIPGGKHQLLLQADLGQNVEVVRTEPRTVTVTLVTTDG